MKKNRRHINLPVLLLLGSLMLMLTACTEDQKEQTITIEIPSSTEHDINLTETKEEDPSETEETTEPEPDVEEPETVSGNMLAEETVSGNTLPEEEAENEPDIVKTTEDGKIIVDLVMFMGQSNMSGTGGNAAYAPTVPEGHGYEFRSMSDPTRLYPIVEPFGIKENSLRGIMDFAVAKKGSLVSSFAIRYYEETGVPIVAVSASEGGTDTEFWLKSTTVSDIKERQKRAQVWLESNNYYIRKQYVIWLQGESDALDNVTAESYQQNMDNIIRPLFIGGLHKVFFITPGRMISNKDFYSAIINAQIELGKKSGYYAVGTTILSAVSTEYMVDDLHYNQSVLNLIGDQAAISAAYYTDNAKEMCLYDYKNNETYIPEGFDYTGEEKVEPLDVNNECGLVRY
ncbi:MAG: sialate O-acetylesterase [Lachnospiraceae bacterium]|nr:sialate O-acetylesterase [Lachnospiraceae bacterium]